MKTYGTVIVWILCITACVMWGLTKYTLNQERAAYKELYDHRPDTELVKEPKSGDVIIRIDGRFYYLFSGVCLAVSET